jgi:hypothetical protein
MTTRNKAVIMLTLIAVFTLLLAACNLQRIDVGETQTRSETVELDDADSVDVELTMGVGELNIVGGESDLMEADFTYNVEDWNPEVTYQVSGGRGELAVTHPAVEDEIGIPDDTDLVYRWDLAFNDDVPMDMTISVGAGETNLSLGTLALNSLSVEGGAGDLTIDLANGRLVELDVNLGAGEVTLDLGGDWSQDLQASLQGGVGELTLILPTAVGVRVTAEGGLGNVNAEGLSQEGDAYVNDAYGDSDVTLNIDVEGGVGDINLRLED